ncbi:MAG: AbrB/MazE/SpoVT family DNA-binding domain-containing protein [archaeon]
MVELRLKVGKKGQILVPKLFRKKYGVKEGETVLIEPNEEGIVIKGRPSPEQVLQMLKQHVEKIRSLETKASKLGELRTTHLEAEFEERQA